MPIINVQILDGRTAAQKSALIAGLADAAKTALGVPDEAIRVLVTELPADNWGIGSRTMAELRTDLGAAPSVDPKGG